MIRPYVESPISEHERRGPVREAGKVKRKRLRWQPSASPDVTGYILYWSRYGEVHYGSEHAQVGKVTEVILPDDVPSFPLDKGKLELGVSAVNQLGNESDLTKLTVRFNFSVPGAPRNLEVEDL